MKNKYLPSVYQVGFLGEGKYPLKSNGKYTKYYNTWRNMIMRCYYEPYLAKNITYKEVNVCDEWKNLQIFAEWFELNYREGFELDKDIIKKGNKLYSPETCCFVPKEINYVLLKRQNSRGDLPLGISIHNKIGKYKVEMSKYGKRLRLGFFDSIDEAFDVYKKHKESYIKELAEKWKNQISESCYLSLIHYEVTIND